MGEKMCSKKNMISSLQLNTYGDDENDNTHS